MNNNYPLIYRLSDDNTTDYTALTNKPTINNVELSGNKSSSDLGLVDTTTVGDLTTLTTTEQSSIVGAINEIDGDAATLAAKFPVAIADGGTGGTTATEARTSLGVMTGVQLYYNASGSSGTIELSDEIRNYQCVDICFFINVYNSLKYNVARIHNLGENTITTSLTMNIAGTYTSGGTTRPRVNAFSATTTITGNALTWGTQNRAYITDSMTPVVEATTSDTPKIYKIIGYKY